MDPETIKGGFFLVMGTGLVFVALQGLRRGWLPNGPKGLERGEGVRRDDNPAGFWVMFALYSGGGGALAVYALRLLAGVG